MSRIRKKLFVCLISASIGALIAGSSNVYAEGSAASDALLQQIAENTYNAWTELKVISQAALVWLLADKSEMTVQMSTNFTQYGAMVSKALTDQTALQVQLDKTLLNTSSPNSTQMADVAKIPNAAQLVYSSLLGESVTSTASTPSGGSSGEKVSSDVDALAYIQNASGIMNKHTVPDPGWQGGANSVTAYANYFNTVMAVESFNNHILSAQYLQRKTAQGDFNTLQTTLITQATADTWFAQVASESIGFVLRQILLYQSQMYVVMTQLIQAQKEQTAAQAMTNALLIINNRVNENTMLSKAQGVQQQP